MSTKRLFVIALDAAAAEQLEAMALFGPVLSSEGEEAAKVIGREMVRQALAITASDLGIDNNDSEQIDRAHARG